MHDLASKVIIEDIAGVDTEIVEHGQDRLDHHGRAAKIVLAILRRGVVLEVAVQKHFVDETCRTFPIVPRLRFRQGGDPAEIVVARLQTVARPDGDGYILEGEKFAVLNGHCADYLIVTARAGDGMTLFIVAADAEGVSRRSFVAVDGSRGADIQFEGVRVDADRILGEAG